MPVVPASQVPLNRPASKARCFVNGLAATRLLGFGSSGPAVADSVWSVQRAVLQATAEHMVVDGSQVAESSVAGSRAIIQDAQARALSTSKCTMTLDSLVHVV